MPRLAVRREEIAAALPVERPAAVPKREWRALVRFAREGALLREVAAEHGVSISRARELVLRAARRLRVPLHGSGPPA